MRNLEIFQTQTYLQCIFDKSDQFSKVPNFEAIEALHNQQPRCMLDYEAVHMSRNDEGVSGDSAGHGLAYRKPRDFLVFPPPPKAASKHTHGRFFFYDVIGPYGQAFELHSWRYDKVVGWEMWTQSRIRRKIFGRPGSSGAREYFRVLGTRFEAPKPFESSQSGIRDAFSTPYFSFRAPKSAGYIFTPLYEEEHGDVFDVFNFFEHHFAINPIAEAQHIITEAGITFLMPSSGPAVDR